MNSPSATTVGPQHAEHPQEWFRALLDNVPAVAFIKDDAGRFVYINKKMRRDSAAAAKGELLGKTSFDYIQAHVVPAVLEQDRRVLENGEAVESVDTLPLLDGSCGHWLVCKFPLRDSEGRRFVAGIAIDVTERKRAEDAIKLSEERFRGAFAHAAIGISVTTLGGHLLHVNPALCALTGRTEAELRGVDFASFTHPDDIAHNRELCRQLIGGEIPSFVLEQRYLTKDSQTVWVRNSVSLMRDDLGKPSAIVALIEDISQRKRADELERERCGLKESVTAMERVLGVVAHELRTPLASVRALAELLLLQESSAGKESDEFLRRMHDEAVRMTETVDSLLEAARLNSGKAKWNWSSVPLEAISRLAVDSIRPLIADAVDVSLEVDPPGARMKGDGDAIRRLLLNLLSNARKHTAEGAIKVSVRLERRDRRQWVQLQITDTGNGIPPDRLSKLGEAFALNSGVVGVDYVSGTGLGLAICKGIVEAHGGHMDITSTPGEGTTVTVILRADLPGPVNCGSVNDLRSSGCQVA